MSRLDAAAIAEAAGILAHCRLQAVALDALPAACRPADLADAYRIQQGLHAALEAGGRGALGGCKIGCTTPVMQRYLGIDQPCAGGIFSDTIHHTDARLRHADYRRPGVECEIAVRLGAALPAAGAPYATATVAPAVDAVMAAIEIVDDRYVDAGAGTSAVAGARLGVPTLIADDFFGAGLDPNRHATAREGKAGNSADHADQVVVVLDYELAGGRARPGLVAHLGYATDRARAYVIAAARVLRPALASRAGHTQQKPQRAARGSGQHPANVHESPKQTLRP